MQQQPLRAREVTMGGIRVSQVAFGTEHLNQYFPAFGGQILRDAAVQNNVFFWDTDNCYGSQPTVAAGIKLLEREKAVVTSKTYANTQKEARESVMRILHDLDTPYLDFCLLHGVEAVSYTHLDVYKRQTLYIPRHRQVSSATFMLDPPHCA